MSLRSICYYSGARTALELVRTVLCRPGISSMQIDDEFADGFSRRSTGPGATTANRSRTRSSMHGDAMEATACMARHRDLAGPQHGRPGQRSKNSITREPASRTNELELREASATARMSTSTSSPRVNYSLLHNNRELLSKLTLTKLIDGPA